MNSVDKDYRYLLLKLVPHHRLARERRKLIGRAVEGNDPAEMRRVALGALEELCASGYFYRGNTDTQVTYQRQRGNYHLTLEVPTTELRELVERDDTAPRQQPSFAVIPEIIRSFAIGAERDSMFERLRATMRNLPSWFGVSAARLVLVEEKLGQASKGDALVTVPEKEIMAQAAVVHSRRSGQVEFLHPEAALALGMKRPKRVNRDAGEPGQVAIAPLFSGEEYWGIIELWLPVSLARDEERSRIEVATGMIEQIIENSIQLEMLTSVDKLTDIYNRNFYDVQVVIEIERAKRSGTKLSMLLIDLDDFKRVNDKHGHKRGDRALMLVADLIKKNLRKIDLPFRWGGEELAILLPGTTEVEAIHTAERLRAVVEAATGPDDRKGNAISITVSIGAAVYPDHASTADGLLEKADEALYKAKAQGKNRVVFYRPPES
jgi:diguanylate cyclase (GGDEF)-like protein